MILYDSSDWLGLVFICHGTVWPHIQMKFIMVCLYTCAAWFVADIYEINAGTEGRTILVSTMSFLLIFRANQAYARYWHGRTMVAEFFSCCREFIMLSMGYIRGGVRTSVFTFSGSEGRANHFPLDKFDERAMELRVDIMRLTLASAIALRMHTHIAWDGYCFGSVDRDTKWTIDWERYRLRQLLTAEEFRLVDACVGLVDEHGEPGGSRVDPLKRFILQFRGNYGLDAEPPDDWPAEFEVDMNSHPRPVLALCQLTRQLIFLHMNGPENTQPWGIKERFVTELVVLLARMEHAYESVNQIISSPLPLPYANLCKLLLVTFLLSMPFFVDYRLGWFANTFIPAVVSLALLGIDAIATELENPFGVDANDLDLLERIHQLECEAVELLRLSGLAETTDFFCWRAVPEWVSVRSCRYLRYYLAVASGGPLCWTRRHCYWLASSRPDVAIRRRSRS
mmetsp:Transcript_145933/g.467823  ORF Transcript_145933/g.467823 Transcript_145933/m.467823 type:complete len:453 (-) Transcript_145933:178-1536(-)